MPGSGGMDVVLLRSLPLSSETSGLRIVKSAGLPRVKQTGHAHALEQQTHTANLAFARPSDGVHERQQNM